MRQFACAVCAHIYDEAIGDPESGIPAGTVKSRMFVALRRLREIMDERPEN